MVSFTQVVSTIFVLYMSHSIWSLYSSFHIKPCTKSRTSACLEPYLHHDLKLKLSVYTSTNVDFNEKKSELIWMSKDFLSSDNFEETVNVKIPDTTRNNGSLYAHVLLYDSSKSRWTVIKSSSLTTLAVPQASTYQLMGDDTKDVKNISYPEMHWNSKLLINVVNEIISLDARQLTADIGNHIRYFSQTKYLPILFIDELSIRINDLKLINNSKEMPLKIVYGPISMGKLKFWTNLEQSFYSFYQFGFSRKDIDEVKNVFVDINLYLLLVTLVVSMFHLLFDFLAFKNDISFWRKRKNMVGLSTRTMAWRSFSTFLVFLYLLDQQTSLLVLIPSGISVVIEIWKLLKAFKITFKWHGWRPKLEIGNTLENEAETAAFDAQAMKWLLRILYPLVICGAIYSLIYTPHKSWYSWTIQSLANGVYAFGFIFMLPQLFINYKLKSVAHLPWKAFTYKAFNTFIDDVFAFIITMPTTHRLACFRDDIVFIIYLYQRWLYPVDKKRVNEFGQSFEQETSEKDSKQKVD